LAGRVGVLDRVQALGLGGSKFFDFSGVVESLRVIKGRILKKFRLRGGGKGKK